MSSFKAFPSAKVEDFTQERKAAAEPGKPTKKTGHDDLEKRMQEAMGRMVVMQRLRLDEVTDAKETAEKMEKIMPQLNEQDKAAVMAYMKRLLEDEQ